MHESGLIHNMLNAMARLRRDNGFESVESVKVEISEFGGWDPDHFRRHFTEAVAGSAWEDVRLDIVLVPMGPEARLVEVTFKS